MRVEIDFHDIKKPGIVKVVELKKGSTALDATKAACSIKQGFACCHPQDVETIEGVACDANNEGWWLYEINGKKANVSAFQYELLDGDQVRWTYKIRGSLEGRKNIEYQEASNNFESSLSFHVRSEKDIPILEPILIHKNQTVCGKGEKPHPCAREYDGKNLNKAVAWLEGISKGKRWDESLENPVLDQIKCSFVPHMIFVRKGSELDIKSSDNVLHTVHAYNQKAQTIFNLAMTGKSAKNKMSLGRPGVLDIQCDAGHRWMQAHIVVLSNPYYSVSNEKGVGRIDGIPPGRYIFHVWHDLFGEKTQEIEIPSKGEIKVETVFVKPKRYAYAL